MNTAALFEGTTFGAELDCGDFDRHKLLPPGSGTWCSIENSSHSQYGFGADPTLKYNMFGGEVQVTPADSEQELLDRIDDILRAVMPIDYTPFSSSIHVHVKIPNLLSRPDLIRYLVNWTQDHWHEFTPHIYKWKDQNKTPYMEWQDLSQRRIKTDVYPQYTVDALNNSDTKDPVVMARILHNNPTRWKGEYRYPKEGEAVMVRRPAVNFSHLRDIGTIEFRMGLFTTNRYLIRNIVKFPMRYLEMALNDDPDPTKIVRGLSFQDKFESEHTTHNQNTSQYFFEGPAYRDKIAILLVQKEITLAELNYPNFWIERGFQ